MRILLVEDDATLRAQLRTALIEAAYVVDETDNGRDAHFLGDTEAFDAVVLDLGLPQLDGLSVLRRKNQALSMITGRVDGPGPDLVQHNRLWLAGLLLVAVLAYWSWEWQQSPSGLLPTAVSAVDKGGKHGKHHDDD